MSERLISRSQFFLIVVASMFWLGCGNATAPVDTAIPLAKNVPQLLQNLDDKSSRSKRSTAANYLGDLGASGELGEEKDKVVAKLQEVAKKDKEPIVKKAATDAIAKIQGGG